MHEPGFISDVIARQIPDGGKHAIRARSAVNLALYCAAFTLLTGCGDTDPDQADDAIGKSSNQEPAVAEDTTEPADPDKPNTEENNHFWLGEPRNDIHRFLGVYGDPENPGRSFFVAEAERPVEAERAPEIPSGYLMIGAMWGDVAPWFFRSTGPLRFEQAVRGATGPQEPIVVTFEADDGDQATALTFQTVFDSRGRLERLRDLPEGW